MSDDVLEKGLAEMRRELVAPYTTPARYEELKQRIREVEAMQSR